MEKWDFNYVTKNNLLVYKYLRGSWSHGIGVEGKSDYDYGGVFLAPKDMILGLRSSYAEQVSDAKNDETYYEFGRWIELLLKSNPTALESLFIDKKFIIGDVHPVVQHIIDNREKFLSKDAFNPLIGYAITQISKATGYNKKCNIPEDFQRKDILDFCYTFKNQGSQPIKDWLKENNLDQKYCGLVNLPNMKDVYGVYYDFAAYFKFENIDWYDVNFQSGGVKHPYSKFIKDSDHDEIVRRINEKEFYHYSGIVKPKDMTIHNPDGTSTILHFDNFNDSETGVIRDSNTVRLSSIPKGETPICFMTYNKDGYASHCREYKEWDEWKKKRNQIRFNDNRGYNFDAKNMCETVRLIHTGIELARDGVFNVERTWDRDFLLNIKNHQVNYDEISNYVKEKKEEFDELLKKSTLPEHLDYDEINNLLIESRKKLYNI